MNLDKFNDKQKEAILTTDGPLLILAGAGSGKTTVVVNKIAYIFQRDSRPNTDAQYNFITYDYENETIISTRKINTFQAMQACDFYKDRIVVLWGSSTSEKGYRVYDTSGNTLATYHLPSISDNEPEGVCIDRDSEVLLISDVNKKIYEISLNSGDFETGTVSLAYSGFYKNKSLSILGDSISTYAGYIPSGNANFYTGSNCGVNSVNDTWWKKVINAFGMSLKMNNSWSGSRVTTTGGNDSAGCMSRCQNLGSNPDVIIVYMGINDFNNEVGLGTYDGNGAFPETTTTFREAYAIMLNKIMTAYKSSEIWVCTLPPCERNGDVGAPEKNGNNVLLDDFNEAIRNLANVFGAKILELAKCGLTTKHIESKVKVLSGGEQAKVRLCKLINRETNVLLLDEPTNHLDVDAKDELKRALKAYKGSILMVCHEPDFYEGWATRVIDCTKWTTKIF